MQIIIWQTDSLELAQLESEVTLTEVELSYYQKITSPARRLEWLVSRVMVRRVLGDGVSTVYDGRRPCLVGSDKHISVSHSDHQVALMVADAECGIDIENSTRDFSRVSRRFLGADEKVEDLAMAWCIKEAAYKMLGVADIDFATMFKIREIELEKGLAVMCYDGVDYQLTIEKRGIYNLAYGYIK